VIEQHTINPSHAVLTQGTGGVALFAVQFAALAGAAVIATSSTTDKLERLRALGAAAAAGELDAARLRAMESEEALDALRSLPGVGPFSAGLILVRGANHPDAFPAAEPRLVVLETATGKEVRRLETERLEELRRRLDPAGIFWRQHRQLAHRQGRHDVLPGGRQGRLAVGGRFSRVGGPSARSFTTVNAACPGIHARITAPRIHLFSRKGGRR
jgi:NADPH:quinone reductase-like Zn-dependent oxidoreductase